MCTGGGTAMSKIPVQIHLMTVNTGHGEQDSYLLNTGQKFFTIPI